LFVRETSQPNESRALPPALLPSPPVSPNILKRILFVPNLTTQPCPRPLFFLSGGLIGHFGVNFYTDCIALVASTVATNTTTFVSFDPNSCASWFAVFPSLVFFNGSIRPASNNSSNRRASAFVLMSM
jgi:hypothetical protein